jgi:hypothetical protein
MDDELGLALSLLHHARRNLTTLEATHWSWTHYERWVAAHERADQRGGGRTFAVVLGMSAGPVAEASAHEQRVWFAAPDRCRTESDSATVLYRDDGRWDLVHDGSQPVLHAPDIQGDPLEGSIGSLADPRALSALVDLDSAGQDRFEDRDVLALRGTAHPVEHLMGPQLRLDLNGADDVRVSVDLETGVLVRLEACLDGQPYKVQELRGLRTGHHISAARFELDLPPGREVLTPEQHFERLEASPSARGLGFSHPHQHEVTGPPPTTKPPPRPPSKPRSISSCPDHTTRTSPASREARVWGRCWPRRAIATRCMSRAPGSS